MALQLWLGLLPNRRIGSPSCHHPGACLVGEDLDKLMLVRCTIARDQLRGRAPSDPGRRLVPPTEAELRLPSFQHMFEGRSIIPPKRQDRYPVAQRVLEGPEQASGECSSGDLASWK